MKIQRVCPHCHKFQTIEVQVSQYNRWMAGENIQIAFPDLTADQREILISGICPECWDKMFPPEEDEESIFN